MERSKVKLLGIIPGTRSSYIKAQTVVFIVIIAAFILSLMWEPPERLRENILFDHLTLFVVIILISEVVETLFTLRK